MRQEKLIAIAVVVAALIFSTATYSFANKVTVIRKMTPVRVQTVDYGMCRVAPCGAVVVRPMMVRRYCPMYMVPMHRNYIIMHSYGHPYPHDSRIMTHQNKRAVMVPNLQNTTYGFRYHNLHRYHRVP